MKLRSGDEVRVIAGKDKGRDGRIARVYNSTQPDHRRGR